MNYLSESNENTTRKSISFVLLDIIRILAALSIVLYHYTQRYDEVIGHTSDWRFSWPWGGVAVDVFFFLSGFLAIYHFKHQSFAVSMVKKGIRLYPTYWTCMVISALVTYSLLRERWPGILAFLINFTMLQSLFGVGSVDGAYWTLWFDIVFYVVIAILQTRKNMRDRINNIMFLWILLAFLNLAVSGNAFNGLLTLTKILNRLLILDRVYAFIVGAMIADLIHEKNKLSFIVFLLSIFYPLMRGNLINSFLLLTVSLIVYFACGHQIYTQKDCAQTTMNGWIAYASSLTYPFYLLHQNVGFAIMKLSEAIGLKGRLSEN